MRYVPMDVPEPLSRTIPRQVRKGRTPRFDQTLIPEGTTISGLLEGIRVEKTTYQILHLDHEPHALRSGSDELIGIYVSEGRINIAAGGQDYDMDEGPFLLINRSSASTIRSVERSSVVGCLTFKIDNSRARLIFRLLSDVTVIREMTQYERDWQFTLEGLISNCPDSLAPVNAAINRRLVEVGLIALIQTALHQKGAAAHGPKSAALSRILPALRLIHADPAAYLPIDRLAAVSGLSRTTFCSYFQDVVGETSTRYISEIRFEMAAELLHDTDLPLVDVARRVGYASDEAFVRAFARRVGHSPGAFRARRRSGLPCAPHPVGRLRPR